jgi:hypothetical protein
LWAVEIKSSPTVRSGDLSGMKSFMKDYPMAKSLCVSTGDQPYAAGDVPVIPWKSLFRKDLLDIA